MKAMKTAPAEKKLGIFARIKYNRIDKELKSPTADQHRVFDKTKGWFARKYPKKTAEIAGRLIADTNSLGITKAAELAEYLVDKGKAESSSKIVAMIEGAAVEGLYVPKDAWEILPRVREKIHRLRIG